MPIAIPEKKALVLKLRDPSQVIQHLPHKLLQVDGQELVAVPHTIEAWRVLRNLGVKVDKFSPLEHRYTQPLIRGQHQPGPHQVSTAAFLTCEPRGYVLSTPRTGKTASALMAIDFLLQEGTIQSALVVAPYSCLRAVWEDEAFGMMPHRSVGVLKGSRQTRLKLLASQRDIYVINPDGLKTIHKEVLKAVKDKRIGFVVVDESTDYANSKSDRWETMRPIAAAADYFHLMTGTPGGPEEVYGQVKLATPSRVPIWYTTWRDRTMIKVGMHKWIPRADHKDHIALAMQPSIRFDKRDVMPWLPKVLETAREAPLSQEQAKMYAAMRRDMLVASREGSITAANAAVMSGKLLQIACGAVITDTGEATVLDAQPRLDALLQIIRETDAKVVVFAPYKAVLRRLAETLRPHYSCAVVDGDVTGSRRDAVFRDFQHAKDPHVLLAHPRTTSFGLELSVADTIVFWGPPINGPFVYQQAIERIQSAQQKSQTPELVHLYSTPVERNLFNNIKAGVSINEGIVEIFRRSIEED